MVEQGPSKSLDDPRGTLQSLKIVSVSLGVVDCTVFLMIDDPSSVIVEINRDERKTTVAQKHFDPETTNDTVFHS